MRAGSSGTLFDDIVAGKNPGAIQSVAYPGECNPEWRRSEMLIILIIVVLVLVFAGGGGYYGYNRWGTGGGAGIGLGTILLVLLVCYLLGLFR